MLLPQIHEILGKFLEIIFIAFGHGGSIACGTWFGLGVLMCGVSTLHFVF